MRMLFNPGHSLEERILREQFNFSTGWAVSLRLALLAVDLAQALPTLTITLTYKR